MATMLVHDYIINSANRYPNKDAVIYGEKRMNYRQLNNRMHRLSRFLQTKGVDKGDRIGLLLENNFEYIIAYYATIMAGGIAVPLNPALKPDGLQYLLNELEPIALITGAKSERLLKACRLPDTGLRLMVVSNPKQNWEDAPFHVATLEDALSVDGPFAPVADLNLTDVASIIYTSGSTGLPKGVMLNHQNIISNTDAICQYLKLTKKDIQMIVLPFFYVMGKSLLNTHMAVGGTVILNNRFMYPADVVHQMIEEKVTGFSGVPSTYAYLLNRSPLKSCREKLTHLRYCSQAGGHMAKSLKFQLKQVLPEHTDIIIMYGATEAAARLTYLEPVDFTSKIDSIGKEIQGVTIRILDNEGNEVPDGIEGELVASGPNIMLGYWKDSDGTAKVLSKHGYHTGDIGYRDQDGFLFTVRRKDGLLKVGGHRVNPTEIEDLLMSSDQVIEAAVVGLPDKMIGNILVATVVTKEDNYDSDHLHEYCTAYMPKHKCPSAIISLKVLPKNANGKIDREACKAAAIRLHPSAKTG